MRRPRTLVWRFGLALMALQLLLAAVVGGYAVIRTRQVHRAETMDELGRLVSVLGARYEDAVASGDEAELGSRVRADGARTGTRITVIDASGLVLADSEVDPGAMENHRYGRREIEEALTDGRGAAMRFSNTIRQRMAYVARRVEVGQTTVIVRTAVPLERIDGLVRRHIGAVAAVAALCIAATFVIIYLLSRRFGRQVAALASEAGRFASGRLDHRVTPPPSRELADLARSLNEMAEELEQRLAEQRAQQAQRRAILQSMHSGVIALDREQRILELNRSAEEILGLRLEAARGRLIQEVVREPALHRFVAGALAGERAARKEIALTGPPHRTLEITAETLQGSGGEPAGVLVLFEDVTRLRRLEAVRSDFAANVSHELRTPITNIKGYVETLLEVGLEDGDQAVRFLEIIRANSGRLAAILDDVLALARLERPEEQAQAGLDRAPTSVADLLRSVGEQFDEEAGGKGIEIRIACADDLVFPLHRQLIEQAVANLVSNAVRYSPEGSAVTITGAAADGALTIEVRDEGPGIPSHHHPRLFERFYRVDKARSRELGGTGLGLAIVKHIAQLHGGRAEVESEVGEGSVFRIVVASGKQGA